MVNVLPEQRQVSVGARQDAANELADRLKGLADTFAANGLKPKRVAYGPSRAAGLLRQRSPRGFLLSSTGSRLVMLLPDGQLWHYHERRNIEGILYDARTDHARSMHGSIPFDGGRFSYLGAVISKYHFGYLEGEELAGAGKTYELGAVVGREGSAARYLKADEAFAAIVSDN